MCRPWISYHAIVSATVLAALVLALSFLPIFKVGV